MKPIMDLPGIGPHLTSKLAEMGISTVEHFVATPSTRLLEIQGLGARRLEILLEAASRVVGLPKEFPVTQEPLVQAAAPTSPKKALRKANKKKAADGKDSKQGKAKNKSKDKKEASKKKSKGKAAAAKKAAAKQAKKAEAKKGKLRKKDKKSRKSKKK